MDASEQPPAVHRRRQRLALWGVLAVAVAARVLAFVDLRRSLYFTNLMPDEGVYDAWARALASGSAIEYVSDFPKLPAYLFAGIYRLFGADVAHARAVNVLLGVAAVAAIYACGALVGGARVAAVAAGMAAITRALVFHSVTLHTTAFAVLLAALLLWVLLAATLHPDRRLLTKAILLGALLGLTVNVRPNLAVLLLLAPVLIWLAARRAGVERHARIIACAGLLAAYFAGAAASGGMAGPAFGFNLYIGNDPANPEPFFRPVAFASSDPARQSVGFTLEASRRAGRVLSSDEASVHYASEIAHGFARAPKAFARKLALKALLVLQHEVPANNHNFAFLAGQLASLRAPWLPDWIVLVLGVLGLVLGSQRNARNVGRWVAGAYASTLVLFFVEERLRAPLLALLLPFAALAIVDAIDLLRAARADTQGRVPADDKRRRLAFALVALALCTLAWLPIKGADGLSTAYNLHALVLYDAGKLDDAARFYRRSAELQEQDSPGAYLGLAAVYERRGDWKGALRTLTKVPDRDYKAAEKYEAAGNIALQHQMLREAAIAYEKSLAIDGGNLRVYKPLAVVCRLLGARTRAADVEQRERYARSFYNL